MKIDLIRGAYVGTSGLSIDGDGSPHCYAPTGSGLVGLDHLANAGHVGNWYGLACDHIGFPYIQPSGYYVSTTALVDRSKHASDPARYVNSETVPYVSVPSNLRNMRMGDVALAVYKDIVCPAIVADVGPANKYWEGSMALATALGIPNSPRDGGTAWGVTMLLWPKSAGGWPRSAESIAKQASDLFSTWGGLDCVRQWLDSGQNG